MKIFKNVFPVGFVRLTGFLPCFLVCSLAFGSTAWSMMDLDDQEASSSSHQNNSKQKKRKAEPEPEETPQIKRARKQRLPLGIQSFRKLREQSCVYVDKTEHIYRLVTEGEKYFLSRPRRFGKSLLVSTLESLFKGEEGLFKGLWIDVNEESNWDWDQKHPVIRLDMSEISNGNPEELKQDLKDRVIEIGGSQGIIISPSKSLKQCFASLIRQLSAEKGQVVVLIDEYDKPIVDHLGENSLDVAKGNQTVLGDFYGLLKGLDEHLRFIFLTGVSKFSKVSVFSKLNNLTDLTMHEDYADFLGYTQEEIVDNFEGHLESLDMKQDSDREETLRKIRKWYNGYRFSDQDVRVYNPVSTMQCLSERKFKSYWFETGTPTFLVNLMKNQKKYEPEDLENKQVSAASFLTWDLENLSLLPLLIQTGYLTIGSLQQEEEEILYTLTYPNREVRRAFLKNLLHVYSGMEDDQAVETLQKLKKFLREKNLDGFMDRLQIFLADVPYDIQISKERYYQSLFYLVCQMLDVDTQAEVRTNVGRMDVVVKTKDRIWIFEMKYTEQAEDALRGESKLVKEALDQIKIKKYPQKYESDNRSITLVGVVFARKDASGKKSARQIVDWVMEDYAK